MICSPLSVKVSLEGIRDPVLPCLMSALSSSGVTLTTCGGCWFSLALSV